MTTQIGIWYFYRLSTSTSLIMAPLAFCYDSAIYNNTTQNDVCVCLMFMFDKCYVCDAFMIFESKLTVQQRCL